MTEEKRRSEFSQFSDWHNAQYGYFLSWANRPTYKNTDAYKYWVAQGRPVASVELEKQLKELTDTDELEAILGELEDSGNISEEQGDELWQRLYSQVMEKYLGDNFDYFNAYVSGEDLRVRIEKLNVSEDKKYALYEYFLPQLDKEAVDYEQQKAARDANLAWRKARGLVEAEAEKAAEKARLTPKEQAQQKAGTEFEKAYAGTPEYAQKKAERQLALETIYGIRPDMQEEQAQQIYAEQTRRAARQKKLDQALRYIENDPTFSQQDREQVRAVTEAMAEEYLSGGSDQLFDALDLATSQVHERFKQTQTLLAGQNARRRELSEALNWTRYNPLIKPEDLTTAFGEGAIYRTVDDFYQSSRTAEQIEDYVKGGTNQFIEKLVELNKNAQLRSNREGQTAEALMAMLNRREPVAPIAQRPGIPSELGVAESALKATGYGEGTKLRSFIASGIAETAQKVRPEREAWWQRETAPPPPEEKTYQDELDRMTAEAERWRAAAVAAPSSEIAGDVAYGPGGLKAIAENAYDQLQKRIGALKPSEDFPLTRTPRPARIAEEDPLAANLKKRRWWEEYTRLPGSGTVPRLQRAVRFR